MSDLPEPKDENARRHWSILRVAVRFLFPKRQLSKQLPDAPPTSAELVHPKIEEITTNEGTTTTTATTTEEKNDESEKRAADGFDTADSNRSSQKQQESSMLSLGLVTEPNEFKPETENTPNQRRKSAWHILRSVKNMLSHFWAIRKYPSEKTEIENKKEEPEIEELSKTEIEELPKPEITNKKWIEMDNRLDEILKKASARIVQFEYNHLGGVLKQCLQHFSIFNLDCCIKKRTMIYWWIGEQLAYETPENVAEQFGEDRFKELYDGGFINPILNYCTGTFTVFRVHPLVHWMIQSKEAITFQYDIDTEKKEDTDKFPHLCLISSKTEEKKEEDHDKERKGEKQKGNDSRNTEASVSKEGSINRKDDKSEVPLGSDTYKVKPVPKLKLGENTRVVYNINAKSPALDEFSPANKLVVLQLGRWNNEQKNFIEVEEFESMKSIGCLKKLKYLGLEGLSRLATLPPEIKELQHLLVLDLRGCQNLEKLGEEFRYLRNLTHLDLTECYMLEYIPTGVRFLSHLQVFKGFVFGGPLTKNRCRLSELSKLRKLRKFSINIISESKIGDNELKDLGKFQLLKSLTITWGEVPVIFEEGGDKEDLLRKWTNLSLPPKLEKFDIRCFPNQKIPEYWFSGHKNLMKLYIRGGKLETLDPGVQESNIRYLRLRYLTSFRMEFIEIRRLLPNLERVEVANVESVKLVGERKEKYGEIKNDPIIKGIWIKDEVAEANVEADAKANAEANAKANATKIATADAPSGQEQPQQTSAIDTTKPVISEEESMKNKGSVDASSTKDATDAPIMEENEPIDDDDDAPTTTEETATVPTAHETAVNQSDTSNVDPRRTPRTTDSEHKVPLQQVSPPTDSEPNVQATQETALNLPDPTKSAPIPPTTDPSKSDATIDDPKILLQPEPPQADKLTHVPTAQITTPLDQSGMAIEERTKTDSPVLAPKGQ